jgi:hypothetical protein
MSATHSQSQLHSKPQRMLTFTGGGWVLVLTALISLGLFTWAMAPAIMRTFNRPPGDGENIDSYGFDVSNLTVPRHLVAAAMLHRDMSPVISDPTSSDVATMQRANDPKYGKYLVPGDLVIGVEIDGVARAYPIHVMYVHEIINDDLGTPGNETPIAVTYNWLCDSVMVFDRRVNDKTLSFHVSGLVYNSNLLMYDKLETERSGESETAQSDASASSGPAYSESLWSQLLGRAISGPAVDRGATLSTIPYELLRWDDWVKRKPHTTVLNRDLRLAAHYKDAAPTAYFQSEALLFPVEPMPAPGTPLAKTRVLAVQVGDARRIYPIPLLLERAKETGSAGGENATRSWTDDLGGATIKFTFDHKWQLPHVEIDPPTTPLHVTHAYWFAWHAMHPEDAIVTSPE